MKAPSSKAARLVPLMRGAGTALGLAGLVASGVLIVATTRLERVASQLSGAVETVYVATQADRALLAHSRECDLLGTTKLPEHRVKRDRARQELDRWLTELAPLAESPIERELFQRIRSDVSAYIAAREQPEAGNTSAGDSGLAVDRLVSAAGRALATLAQLNHEESQTFQRAAELENTRANVIGWSMVGFVLLVGAGVFYLLNRQIEAPLKRMKERIVGLEAGKLAPLPLDGPAEFRGIAVVFNELIAQLQLQRESQLRFLAGIAHDLRTPLQAIKLSAELLGDHLSAEQRATVRTIDRQISQLDWQVGDLLDTTRIESGQLELRISEQDLAQLVETSAKVFRSLSARHHIQVIAPDKPIIYPCDPTRIGQVVNNLLSNAIKYSPSGGEITAALSASASGVEFAVTDQGIGISAEDILHVFEPFRRTAATREAIPGVGLGLSVARRIAEAHGGSIEVKSVPAAGSSFTLSLPKTPPR